jgi:hypothetical protein
MAIERRIRIGDWLIPYDDAAADVTVMRTMADILRAEPGNAEECMNSQCIKAQRNRHVFPHPVYVVSTTETRVYVVDRLDDSGEPAHAIRYELYPKDSKAIKAHDLAGAGEPGELRLRKPQDPKGSPKRAASPAPRYRDLPAGQRWKDGGDGKVSRPQRPVTMPLGAKRRYVVAVGALRKGTDDAQQG